MHEVCSAEGGPERGEALSTPQAGFNRDAPARSSLWPHLRQSQMSSWTLTTIRCSSNDNCEGPLARYQSRASVPDGYGIKSGVFESPHLRRRCESGDGLPDFRQQSSTGGFARWKREKRSEEVQYLRGWFAQRSMNSKEEDSGCIANVVLSPQEW
jgi:hypothetical protein